MSVEQSKIVIGILHKIIEIEVSKKVFRFIRYSYVLRIDAQNSIKDNVNLVILKFCVKS